VKGYKHPIQEELYQIQAIVQELCSAPVRLLHRTLFQVLISELADHKIHSLSALIKFDFKSLFSKILPRRYMGSSQYLPKRGEIKDPL
jgi:hypothetical protein